MNILTLNYEFPPVGGGAGPATLDLCRELVRLGHHVDVVTMRYDSLLPFECLDGVKIYRTPALRSRPDLCRTHEMATYLPGALPTVLRLTRQIKYDLIHCHFIIPTGPLAWLTSRITGIPFLITAHGSDVPDHNPDRFVFLHSLLKPAWQFLVQRSPLIITPSESLKKLICRHNPLANVRVIPNGIHTHQFCPDEQFVTLPDRKKKNILMCGRLLQFKGFQYALEAIKQMKLDWPVHIVGDGRFMPELKRIAEDAETAIKFWGWLDRDDRRFKMLFERCSIFIFPSESENFPTVLLEAMAAGMAVITSTAGGCPEVVGKAGLLVEPRDSVAIQFQLKKLTVSEDLRRELSLAARRRAAEFGWSYVACKYLDQYQNVIEYWNK